MMIVALRDTRRALAARQPPQPLLAAPTPPSASWPPMPSLTQSCGAPLHGLPRTTGWHAASTRCTPASDGDTLFSLGTGCAGKSPGMMVLATMAAEATARATVRQCRRHCLCHHRRRLCTCQPWQTCRLILAAGTSRCTACPLFPMVPPLCPRDVQGAALCVAVALRSGPVCWAPGLPGGGPVGARSTAGCNPTPPKSVTLATWPCNAKA